MTVIEIVFRDYPHYGATLVFMIFIGLVNCIALFDASSRSLRTIIRCLCALAILLSFLAAAGIAIWKANWEFIGPFIAPIILGIISINRLGRATKTEDAQDILLDVLTAFIQFAKQKDISLMETFKHVIAKSWRPFVLYLRPFYVDTELNSSNPIGPSNDFEELMEREVGLLYNLPVLALGEDKVSGGSSRLQLTDQFYAQLNCSWKHIAITLMKGAEFIILWPSCRAGTLWEINACLKNFSEKTFFVFPDAVSFEDQKAKDMLASDFTSLRMAMLDAGFYTPNSASGVTWWRYGSQKKLIVGASLKSIQEGNSFRNRVGAQ